MDEPYLGHTDSDSDEPEHLDLPELQSDIRDTKVQGDAKIATAPGGSTNANTGVIQRTIVDVDNFQLSDDFIRSCNSTIIVNNEPVEVKDEGDKDDPIDLTATIESQDPTVAAQGGQGGLEDTPLPLGISNASITERLPGNHNDPMQIDTSAARNYADNLATTNSSSLFGGARAPRAPSPASAALDATSRSRNARQQARNRSSEPREMVLLDERAAANINSFELPSSRPSSPMENGAQPGKRRYASVENCEDSAVQSKKGRGSQKSLPKRRLTKMEEMNRKKERKVVEKLKLKKKHSTFSHINTRPSSAFLSNSTQATGFQQREKLRQDREKRTKALNAAAASAVARQQAKQTIQDRNKSKGSKDGRGSKRSSHKKQKRPSYSRAAGIGELVSQISQRHDDASRTESDQLRDAQRTFAPGSVSKWSDDTWYVKGMQSRPRHHQLIGSAWMIQQEKTAEHKGGILGDDPGLGKTVQSLALMVAKGTARDVNISTLVVCPANLTKQWSEEVETHLTHPGKVSIYRTSNHADHMSEDELASSFCIITSYGEVVKSMKAAACPNELVEEAQIMEWYETEGKHQVNVLHRVHWHRVILDECTNIKNHESMAARACSLLIADHRWLLSGTPLTNGPEELYSYLLFLQMQVATGSYEHFYNNFIQTRTAMERMQQLLRAIMLRRRIDDRFLGCKIVKLPACGSHTVKFAPTRLEQVIIEICEERLRYHVNEIIKRHQQERRDPSENCLAQRNRNILVLMLRMRQILCHPLLAAETIQKLFSEDDCNEIRQVQADSHYGDSDHQTVTHFRNFFAEADAKMRGKPVDEARNQARSVPNGSRFSKSQISGRKFLEILDSISRASENDAEQVCVRCNRRPSGSVTGTAHYRTDCNHLYCRKCLEEHIQEYRRQNPAALKVRCFRCDHVFKHEEVKEEWESPRERERRLLKTRENQDTSWIDAKELMPSTKMMGVKALISGWLKDDPSTKIIVFVQFRAAIKCLQRICRDEHWNALTYHGGMSLKAREKAIDDFKDRRSQNILLATQPSGGVGLNLTCATKVISLDFWWNYAAEQQSFCRIFRIGQTKQTTVVRIAIENSMDMRMLEIQERKMAGINKALNDDDSMMQDLTTDDLLELFGDADKHEKGFIVPKKPETEPYRGGHRYEPFNFGYYEAVEVEHADDAEGDDGDDQDDDPQQQQGQHAAPREGETQQGAIVIEDDGGEVEDSSDE